MLKEIGSGRIAAKINSRGDERINQLPAQLTVALQAPRVWYGVMVCRSER